MQPWKPRNWNEFKDRVAPKGSDKDDTLKFIKRRGGTVTYEELSTWIRTTPFIPESFTDEQVSIAVGSQLETLENYGAITEENGKIHLSI